MKKIISLILTATMLMSLVVMTAGAENIGEGIYAPNMPTLTETAEIMLIDENQVDAQGIYYTLNDEDMTAIVGKNTYADSASADAGLTTDSIVIPYAVKLGDNQYTVTAVGRNAFDGTDIREIVIACATIGEFAFAGCTELEYVFSNASEIKGFAFWGCTALTEIFAATAQDIGGGAFWNCSNLRNVSLMSSTIMEKAFEGCDSLEYIVFGGDAPAVAAGALGTVAKAYVYEDATGYEDFPIATEVLAAYIVDVEDVYGKPGETVEVSVMVPAGISEGDFEIGLNLAEGLTVAGIVDGFDNLCFLENAAYDAGKLTGTNSYTFIPGTLVALQITLPADAAGTYAITATSEIYTCIAGSITVCDHADTKTVTVKAASCDEAGTENTVCVACGEIISSADVEAKGHSYKDFVIAPTCTEDGYTRHICDCCADSYSDAETEALGHVMNEGEVIVPVSTTKNGLVRYTCLTCGTTEDVIIPKIVYGDANCDENINTSDAAISLQYIAGWDLSEKTFSEVNADVDGDNAVKLSDVSLLMKYIAGWEGITFGPQK